MLATVSVFPQTDANRRQWFEAECDALPIRTNCPELAGELVTFTDDTREGVIGQVVGALKARGLTGTLRVR